MIKHDEGPSYARNVTLFFPFIGSLPTFYISIFKGHWEQKISTFYINVFDLRIIFGIYTRCQQIDCFLK